MAITCLQIADGLLEKSKPAIAVKEDTGKNLRRLQVSIRREPLYVSTDVWRALWLLSKADRRHNSDDTGIIHTPDQIADDMLRQSLREVHPQLFEHQKQVEKLEKELIKTLQ